MTSRYNGKEPCAHPLGYRVMTVKILKTIVVVTAVLWVGQIKVSGSTIGEHFVGSVNGGAKWTVRNVIHSKMLGGFELPKFIKDWLGEGKAKVEAAQAEVEELTSAEQERLMQLLN